MGGGLGAGRGSGWGVGGTRGRARRGGECFHSVDDSYL